MNQALFDLLKPYLAGQLRHALTGMAGALVLKGIIAPSEQGPFVEIVSGMVAYAIGAGWSWYQKNGIDGMKAKLAALQAVKKPPAASVGKQ